jgi:DinB family protein
MRYTLMRQGDQESLMAGLLAMPDALEASFSALPPGDAMQSGPDGGLSPVEICWHLADLEAEGYAVRIRRLLAEESPQLPDFDGGAVAQARNYRALSLADGLTAFRAARRANVDSLRRLTTDDWLRSGTQAGVGPVALCDIPSMMAEHDAGHREEVDAWITARRR